MDLIAHVVVYEFKNSSHVDSEPTALDPAEVNFAETKVYDISCDGDWSHRADLPRYELRRVMLPPWMSIERFAGIEYQVSLRYCIAYGMDLTWPQAWVESILALQRQRFAVIDLLKSDPDQMRSPMRISIRNQVIIWCETAQEDRRFALPMSPKQFNAIMGSYSQIRERRIAESVYRNRKPMGDVMQPDAAMEFSPST